MNLSHPSSPRRTARALPTPPAMNATPSTHANRHSANATTTTTSLATLATLCLLAVMPGIPSSRGAEAAAPSTPAATGPAASTNSAPVWPTRPLSLADCLNLAEAQNGSIASARKDLEASEGIVIQTRAVLLPGVQASGSFRATEDSAIEAPTTPLGTFSFGQTESWDVGIRVVQSIYEGGRMASARRSSRLTREAAVNRFQTSLLDAFLEVRVTYYRTLLALEQIAVQEASVHLLERELQDNQRRFDAGSVPRFNVLRAEVELANARPRLIRSRNAWRNGKTYLASLLGYRVPNEITEDVPLELSDRLETPAFDLGLGQALNLAQEHRTELKALRATEQLRREGIVVARAGQRPSVQGFAGYGARRSQFGSDLGDELHGWNAGVQATWNIFDGGLSRGRIVEAGARHEQATLDYDNAARQISVEVRTAYSNFLEARDVLESQRKVVEQATEALRLATARSEAGSGTQLDVLSAQTALTEARTTQNLARHDYLVALARLQRAVGKP